ncbi:MAG: fibronectin type III domain-containing protein [Desulfuromonadales bacterium]|nr:fibronectin type III domain-containing protein [Desulfuromonadales bacterium]
MKKITVLLFILLALAACGKKGPVRPQLLSLPAAPTALSIEQRGERFLLSWGVPDLNQDGTPLTDLAGFRIERLRYDLTEGCPECRDDFQPVVVIDLDYLRDTQRLGDRLLWWDAVPRPGSGYSYRVVPVTVKGRDGAPARQKRPFVAPPSPPQQLVATSHDRQVRLDWQRPEAAADGQVTGWHVYRWLPTGSVPLVPVTSRPLTDPFFEDLGLENGQTYLYTVTTIVEQHGFSAESLPAETVRAQPRAEP